MEQHIVTTAARKSVTNYLTPTKKFAQIKQVFPSQIVQKDKCNISCTSV